MAKAFIGIDVSKREFTAAIATEQATPATIRKCPTRTFPHSCQGIQAFIAWVNDGNFTPAILCAEATGVYSIRLAADIHHQAPLWPQMAITNPAWIKGTVASLGLRDKTDLLDAAAIAFHAKVHQPRPSPQPSPLHDALSELFALRDAAIRQRTATLNRLEQVRTQQARTVLERCLKDTQQQIDDIDAALDKCIAHDEQMRRDSELLQSVRGVGRILAIALLAEFGDLRHWKRGQLISFAGIYPRRCQSGTSVSKAPRLAKGGAARLRRVLYMAALTFSARGPGANRHQRFQQRGKSKMCSIGAQMRQLLLIARGVVVSGQPFDPSRLGPSFQALSA